MLRSQIRVGFRSFDKIILDIILIIIIIRQNNIRGKPSELIFKKSWLGCQNFSKCAVATHS
uniref:Uncharacterized protein n=1 Tax=Anguilla anguilla TaxID=7936 RepID=A0A0E9WDJ6_ANGAN